MALTRAVLWATGCSWQLLWLGCRVAVENVMAARRGSIRYALGSPIWSARVETSSRRTRDPRRRFRARLTRPFRAAAQWGPGRRVAARDVQAEHGCSAPYPCATEALRPRPRLATSIARCARRKLRNIVIAALPLVASKHSRWRGHADVIRRDHPVRMTPARNLCGHPICDTGLPAGAEERFSRPWARLRPLIDPM
jgi:hypothetical protein